jgi:SAM-dependent methyltransferase
MTSPVADTAGRTPMPMEPTGPCWVCGAEAWDPVWQEPFDLSNLPRFGPELAHAGHPPSRMLRCRACGFGQPEAMPARTDYLDTLYDIPFDDAEMDRQFTWGYKDFIFRTILEELGRRLPPGVPRTLLDVGCHIGTFLPAARAAGWDVEGAELAPRTAAYAARRTGLAVHQVPAQELVAHGRRYGVVTLTDVLEHIPRPAPLVAELRGLLHPGGLLAIKVPHGPMQRLKERIRRDLLRKPDAGVMTRYVHVNHFTVRSLRRCLESAGFRDVAVKAGAPEFLPPSPGRTRGQAASAIVRRAVYRAAEVLPGGVHTPLAMNLQAFGTNPGGSSP